MNFKVLLMSVTLGASSFAAISTVKIAVQNGDAWSVRCSMSATKNSGNASLAHLLTDTQIAGSRMGNGDSLSLSFIDSNNGSNYANVKISEILVAKGTDIKNGAKVDSIAYSGDFVSKSGNMFSKLNGKFSLVIANNQKHPNSQLGARKAHMYVTPFNSTTPVEIALPAWAVNDYELYCY